MAQKFDRVHEMETHSLVRILCVANQNGGVGKTTTAVNLSVALAKADKKTLLVDLDPCCRATLGLSMKTTQRLSLLQMAAERPRPWAVPFDILPGSFSMEDADTIANLPSDRGKKLAECFRDRVSDLDFVVIDSPSSLAGATEWALLAADEILVPLACEYFALEPLPQLIELVRRVMAAPHPALDFAGVLLTKRIENLELTEQVELEVREFFGDIVFESAIPQDHECAVALKEGRSVIDFAPRSRRARAYIEFCKEVIEQ